jgi:glyoxylase-like metal-dependent hydrolase (beta-lactamase superfamily II)
MAVTEVQEGVHRLTLGVCNWYLIAEGDALVLVDAGVRSDWKLLVSTLASMNRSLSDVKAVLLTHAHSDHTGFAERARTEADAAVHVHQRDERVARTGKLEGKRDASLLPYLRYAEAYRTLFSLIRRGGTRIVPIREVRVFEDGEVLDLPGSPRVVHAPGHTVGSAAILFERRSVLFTGDALVTRNPLTGRIGPQVMPAAFNTDSTVALESLASLERATASTVLPGHGEPWKEGVAEAVRHARQAGRS